MVRNMASLAPELDLHMSTFGILPVVMEVTFQGLKAGHARWLKL
jgi:hypothetical protein